MEIVAALLEGSYIKLPTVLVETDKIKEKLQKILYFQKLMKMKF